MTRTFYYSTSFVLIFCASIAIFGIPANVSAAYQNLHAGFAPLSLWISNDSVIAGQTVTVYATVYNSSQTPIVGDVTFYVDGTVLGTQHLELSAGAAQIASMSWVVALGTHNISASILKTTETTDNAAVSVTNQAMAPITVTGSAPTPPPTTPTSQTVSGLSAIASQSFASASPVVIAVATSTYADVEQMRVAAAQDLEKDLAQSEAGNTAAQNTQPGQGALSSVKNFIASMTSGKTAQTAWQILLKVLIFILNTPIVFYASIVGVTFICFAIIF